MSFPRPAAAFGAGLSAVALTLALAGSAQAAGSGWHVVPLSIRGLALIPGTHSLWAAGGVPTTPSGDNAAVFAHGTP